MATKDGLRVFVTSSLLLWLGLMFAPVLMATEAWQEIEHPTLDVLFADASGPVVAYQEVYLDSVSVWYPDTTTQSPQQAESLRRRAAQYFAAAFSSRGLTVVDKPTEGALVVRVQLIDLESAPVSPDVLDWARGFRFRVQPGNVTLLAELVDAQTNRVMVRMADMGEQADEPDALLSNLDSVLAHWGDVIASLSSERTLVLLAQIATK